MKHRIFLLTSFLLFYSLVSSQTPYIDVTELYNQYGDTAVVDAYATEIDVHSSSFYQGSFLYAPVVKIGGMYVRYFKFYLAGFENFSIQVNGNATGNIILYKYGNGNEDNAISLSETTTFPLETIDEGLYVLNLITRYSSNTYEVEISPLPATLYSITAFNDGNGTVTPSQTSAAAGETITLTVAPNDGYELNTLTAMKASNGMVEIVDNQFVMPDDNVVVTATFKTVSAVSQTAADNLSVFVKNRTVSVENAASAVQVLDISGRVVAQGAGSGIYEVSQAGVYIVKSDAAVRKVVVN